MSSSASIALFTTDHPLSFFYSFAVILFVAYALGLTVYRVTLHPLSNFPGPRLVAITRWYEFYYDALKGEGGQYAWKVQDLHKRYGPIVRVSPDEIHIQDPSYFETIYATSPARRDKYALAAAMLFAPLGTFGTVQHDIHRKRRLANSALFSRSALRNIEQFIYERVGLTSESLISACAKQQVVHLHTKLLALTTDLTISFTLGHSQDCQLDNTKASNWNMTMRVLPRLVPLVKQFPWALHLGMKLPTALLQTLAPQLISVLELYQMTYSESQIHAQKREATKFGNFDERPKTGRRLTVFESIDASNLPMHEKSVPRQAQEAFVLVAAGTETTARCIGTILFHLIDNPSTLIALREELHSVLPDRNARPDVTTLEKNALLIASIKEGMRVMRLMTSRLPLVAPNDLQYHEWTIPAGTPVSMTISDILTDPELFPDPHAFRPERWLDEDGQLHHYLDRFFVPFGRGTRVCQGKDLAWAEMCICISQLVRWFDFELYDTVRARDVDVVRDCFLGTTTEKSAGIRIRVVGVRQ